MHEALWAGVEVKRQYAAFHLQKMGQSLEPPEQTATHVALKASGAIIDTGWQRVIWPHFDAFLSAARSIPEIIQCCFGADLGHPIIKQWFGTLSAAEQARRKEFRTQFKPEYERFRKLPLGTARDTSVHRTGIAGAEVQISGMFGITYTGSAVKPLPLAETRPIDNPALAWLPRPRRLLPSWEDFVIDGQPLFTTCQEYLDSASVLIAHARSLAENIHGTQCLTSPPQG
jgi:hypothetical protein